MLITKTSAISGEEHTMDLNVTSEQLERFMNSSENIQDIFPQLNADEREFILSGITKEEWDAMYPPDEEIEQDYTP